MTKYLLLKCYIIIMKKYLVVMLFAILMGSFFAIFIFFKKEDTTLVSNNINKAYLYQLGAFKNYNYAQKYLDSLPGGIIINNNDYYYVYTNLYQNDQIIMLLNNYYQDNQIKYFIKEITISDKVYNELIKYEEILLKSENIETILKTSNNILNLYKDNL